MSPLPPSPAPTALPAGSALPHVRAMLVGPNRSGKTMQLAAMHHQLSVGDAGIRVKPADSRTLTGLGEIVSRILASEPVPPPGNSKSDITEWNFDIEAGGPDLTLRPLFRLTYLDYAGELNPEVFEYAGAADEVESPAMRTFRDSIASFDVLLGVLDGEKIARAMSDETTPADLEQEIWHTLELLSTGHQDVIHLMITKFDELVVRGFNLENVRAHLDAHPAFHGLRAARPRGSLRIIPVSALGSPPYLIPDETRPTAANGGPPPLVKADVGPWKPISPGLPLACGLRDIVAADLARIGATDSGVRRRSLAGKPSAVFAAFLDGLGLVAAPATLGGRKSGLTLVTPARPVLDTFTRVLFNPYESRSDKERQLLALGGRTGDPRRAATASLLAYCVSQVHHLERAFPASLLGPGPAVT